MRSGDARREAGPRTRHQCSTSVRRRVWTHPPTASSPRPVGNSADLSGAGRRQSRRVPRNTHPHRRRLTRRGIVTAEMDGQHRASFYTLRVDRHRARFPGSAAGGTFGFTCSPSFRRDRGAWTFWKSAELSDALTPGGDDGRVRELGKSEGLQDQARSLSGRPRTGMAGGMLMIARLLRDSRSDRQTRLDGRQGRASAPDVDRGPVHAAA